MWHTQLQRTTICDLCIFTGPWFVINAPHPLVIAFLHNTIWNRSNGHQSTLAMSSGTTTISLALYSSLGWPLRLNIMTMDYYCTVTWEFTKNASCQSTKLHLNSHIWQSLSLSDWRWKATATLGWMGAISSASGSWPPRGTAIATRPMRI